MNITEFLEARIAGDEERAKLASFGWGAAWKSAADHDDEWYTIKAEGKREVVGGEDSDVINHIARHDPARILAECEAKRAIIAGIIPERYPQAGPPDYDPLWIIRAIAAVYADHPDYQQEWAK